MIEFWHFLLKHRFEVLGQLYEHVWLTLVALALAVLIGLPLGVLLTRFRRTSGTVLGAVGVIQTIPSIALLGFLLPLMGIGAAPAIVALFLYALLPIVRNAYAGVDEVDPAVVEAARGMGMSDRQLLMKVELPLAVPVIFAGIRTATVINVGVATLCALIGAGGLGVYIFRGIALNNMSMILAGAVPAALLALAFDGVLGLLQRYIRRLFRPLLYAGAVALILLAGWSGWQWSRADSFKAGLTSEFIERADGWKGLKKAYDLDLPVVEMESSLMYGALRDGRVDVIGGYSTDGRIKAFNLRVLNDDKHYFPPYSCAPLVRESTLRKYPEIRGALNRLSGLISNREMVRMNYEVDQEHRDPEAVARAFLESKGLKTGVDREGAPDIVIGGKNFTEHFILGQMLALLIENYTGLTVQTRLGLQGTQIVFEALRSGEIDLYPEYTGTGLHVLLHADSATVDSLGNDSNRVYKYVKQQTEGRYKLTWLQPLGFENTYALMMREEQARRMGIETISDLARAEGSGQ